MGPVMFCTMTVFLLNKVASQPTCSLSMVLVFMRSDIKRFGPTVAHSRHRSAICRRDAHHGLSRASQRSKLSHKFIGQFMWQFYATILCYNFENCRMHLSNNFYVTIALRFSVLSIWSCTPVFMWFGFSNYNVHRACQTVVWTVLHFYRTIYPTVLYYNFVLQFWKLSYKFIRPLHSHVLD